MSLLSDPAQRVLVGALDGLSRRQELIAANLANIDTPGYRPSSIDFEGALRAELDGAALEATGGALRPPTLGPSAASELRRTDPRHFAGDGLTGSMPAGQHQFDGSIRNDANTVDLESEMTALAESQLRYGAVSRLVTAKLGLLRDVARGGR